MTSLYEMRALYVHLLLGLLRIYTGTNTNIVYVEVVIGFAILCISVDPITAR